MKAKPTMPSIQLPAIKNRLQLVQRTTTNQAGTHQAGTNQFGVPPMIEKRTRAIARFATAALALVATHLPAQAAVSTAHDSTAVAEKYAIKAGRIITMDGEDITDGVIVIEGGRITAIGPAADIEVPWDAEVLEVPNGIAFPGFIEAHVSRGMDRSNESVDVAAFLNVKDSIDPINFYFEDCKRWGVTTINVQQGNSCVIAAQGRVVKPTGMTIQAMTIRPTAGLKMSASPKSGKSRGTQAQALRRSFADLRRYLQQLVDEKKAGDDRARREALYQGRDLEGENAKGRAMTGSGWTIDGLELVPRGEIDEKQEPLLSIVEGKLPVWFYCGGPAEVATAIDIARTNGFLQNTTLVLGTRCWKAADQIKEAGVSVVLSATLNDTERDPISGEETETFVPGVFKEKGITYALQSSNSTNQSLWFQAATCVSYGMSRADALASVTTTPAAMLGLQDRVGKLAKGYDGNVLLMSGDPLSITTHLEYMVIEGELVYDRSTDVRAKHLIDAVEPAGTVEAEEAPEAETEEEKKDGDD